MCSVVAILSCLSVLACKKENGFRVSPFSSFPQGGRCEVACLSRVSRRSMHPCLCILGASRRASRRVSVACIALLWRAAHRHSLIVALY